MPNRAEHKLCEIIITILNKLFIRTNYHLQTKLNNKVETELQTFNMYKSQIRTGNRVYWFTMCLSLSLLIYSSYLIQEKLN